MRFLVALIALAALVPFVPAVSAASSVVDYTVVVGDEVAHGLLSVPESSPSTLVVVTHGWGHTAESHRGHLQALADEGYLGVAMDFRGTGFPLGAGAADTEAAVYDLLTAYPSVDEVVMFSVSMGTAPGAMVIADNPGLVSRWFLSEPMANLAETWAEASAVCPFVAFACAPQQQIEAECGGTPVSQAECFRERVAVARVPEFVGVRDAVVVHGVNDGLVPHNQGREVTAALRAHDVATDFYAVLRGDVGGEGTTLTGHGGSNFDGWAGHGTESNDDHTVTKLSWELFFQWIDGASAANGEFVIDRELGRLP